MKVFGLKIGNDILVMSGIAGFITGLMLSLLIGPIFPPLGIAGMAISLGSAALGVTGMVFAMREADNSKTSSLKEEDKSLSRAINTTKGKDNTNSISNSKDQTKPSSIKKYVTDSYVSKLIHTSIDKFLSESNRYNTNKNSNSIDGSENYDSTKRLHNIL